MLAFTDYYRTILGTREQQTISYRLDGLVTESNLSGIDAPFTDEEIKKIHHGISQRESSWTRLFLNEILSNLLGYCGTGYHKSDPQISL